MSLKMDRALLALSLKDDVPFNLPDLSQYYVLKECMQPHRSTF